MGAIGVSHYKPLLIPSPHIIFRCRRCSYFSVSPNKFNQHIKTKHLKKTPPEAENTKREFGCDDCPFRTTTEANMERHKKIFCQWIQHICSVCNNTVGSVGDLRAHIAKLHPDSGEHKCTRCQIRPPTVARTFF